MFPLMCGVHSIISALEYRMLALRPTFGMRNVADVSYKMGEVSTAHAHADASACIWQRMLTEMDRLKEPSSETLCRVSLNIHHIRAVISLEHTQIIWTAGG